MPGLFDAKGLLEVPTTRAAYSDRVAWLMANFSKMAYDDARRVQDGLGRIGYRYLRFIPRQGTECFLGEGPELAVLSFRGTEPTRLKDILTDLDCDFNKDDRGTVLHDGFLKAYNAVKEEILATLERLTKPLYVTGHSLGGALASIAAYSLESQGRPVAACYTYGSPRVGDGNFARTLEKTPVYRLVNSTDVVPRVPLKAQRYVHVGQLHYLNDAGRLFRPTEGSEVVSQSDFFKVVGGSLLARLAGSRLAAVAAARPLIENHSIDHYMRKLKAVAQDRN
jgi:predicted lipase